MPGVWGLLSRLFLRPEPATRRTARSESPSPTKPDDPAVARKLSGAQRAQVITLYQAGHGTGEIAKTFGVSRQAVQKMLRKAGAFSREQGQAPVLEVQEEDTLASAELALERDVAGIVRDRIKSDPDLQAQVAERIIGSRFGARRSKGNPLEDALEQLKLLRELQTEVEPQGTTGDWRAELAKAIPAFLTFMAAQQTAPRAAPAVQAPTAPLPVLASPFAISAGPVPAAPSAPEAPNVVQLNDGVLSVALGPRSPLQGPPAPVSAASPTDYGVFRPVLTELLPLTTLSPTEAAERAYAWLTEQEQSDPAKGYLALAIFRFSLPELLALAGAFKADAALGERVRWMMANPVWCIQWLGAANALLDAGDDDDDDADPDGESEGRQGQE